MLSNFGIWELLILVGIVVLLFGTNKLRNLGGDIGHAIREFRHELSGNDDSDKADERLKADEADEQSSDSTDKTRSPDDDRAR